METIASGDLTGLDAYCHYIRCANAQAAYSRVHNALVARIVALRRVAILGICLSNLNVSAYLKYSARNLTRVE